MLGHPISTRTATLLALGLILAGALIALLTTSLARRRRRDDAHTIQSRHGSLLLPIKTPTLTDHGETVDVQDFATLARTAERHGLVIMTWPSPTGQTYMVQDQAIRYRHTTTPTEGRRTRNERRHRHGSRPSLPPVVTTAHHNATADPQ